MKIKDLPKDSSLAGVKFKAPNGIIGIWCSQWQKGIWYKKDIHDTQVFPLLVDSLEEALEFDVLEAK